MFAQRYGIAYYSKRFPMMGEETLLASTDINLTVATVLTQLIYLSVFAMGQTIIRGKIAAKTLFGVGVSAVAITRSVSQGLSIACAAVVNSLKHIGKSFRVSSILAVAVRKQTENLLLAISSIYTHITKHKEYKFDFTGAFAPGDEVKINTKTMQVTLNGVNALHLTDGAFPILTPGAQELVYMDNEGTRSVRITVQWRDKWL